MLDLLRDWLADDRFGHARLAIVTRDAVAVRPGEEPDPAAAAVLGPGALRTDRAPRPVPAHRHRRHPRPLGRRAGRRRGAADRAPRRRTSRRPAHPGHRVRAAPARRHRRLARRRGTAGQHRRRRRRGRPRRHRTLAPGQVRIAACARRA
ncbi:hypothetical protein LT493_00455 [Streptomyces tricolor]|nr:hypothetical protein [Streptomyces tricolor]